jgi:hypothetical protein
MNVRDLIKYLADKHANQRSTVIHAAATAECVKPTLVMERPMYEEKNASIPVSAYVLMFQVAVAQSYVKLLAWCPALAAETDRFPASRRPRSPPQ